MKGKWFTPKEITKIEHMPKTIQGVHKRAKREGWGLRRKAGTQGPGVEYYLTSQGISPQVQEMLPFYQTQLQITEANLQGVWLSIFNQLSAQEKTILLSSIIQYGVSHLLQYQLTRRIQAIGYTLSTLPHHEQETILNFIETKLLTTGKTTASVDKKMQHSLQDQEEKISES